jgi:uridine kinase
MIRPLLFEAGVEAAARLLAERQGHVRIFAIDGHSAAGKSTFAAALAARLDAALIPGDDFYRVMNDEERAQLSPSEGIERYFDWERMRAEVLVPLRDGRDAVYRAYDWGSGLLTEEATTIGAASAVVVDGVYSSRPELEEFFELSVFVSAPEDGRSARQLQRGDTVEWLRRWDDAEKLFFAQVRPPQSFDLVVSGVDRESGRVRHAS